MLETLRNGLTRSSSVVLGLSGGVDSAVAALLLKEAGYQVVAVTLGLWEPENDEAPGACCSPTAVAKAKAVADRLRIPHYVVDRTTDFRERVVDYFIQEYAKGRTPNPCAKCNATLRFEALLDTAQRLGAGLIATGHYARLTGEPPRLSRGVDPHKDQSYVLSEVRPELLQRCLFPVGELTKAEVRAIAARAGLEGAVSAESQEICFVAGDYRDFLRDRLGERPGIVVDEQGAELARHTGTYNFTVGQRKGLGGGHGGVMYVSEVDAQRGRVVVSYRRHADAKIVLFRDHVPHRERPRGRVQVQVRSMGAAVQGRLRGSQHVVLDKPVSGLASGQTLAVYDGDDLILGATIVGGMSGRSALRPGCTGVFRRACDIVKALAGR